MKYKLLKLERKVLELEYGEGSVFYIKFGILLGTAQKSTRIYFVLRRKKNTGMCMFPYSWGKNPLLSNLLGSLTFFNLLLGKFSLLKKNVLRMIQIDWEHKENARIVNTTFVGQCGGFGVGFFVVVVVEGVLFGFFFGGVAFCLVCFVF